MTALDHPRRPALTLTAVWRLLATLLAGLLFAAGWAAGALVGAAMWCATAVRLGWDDVRQTGGG